MNALSVGTVISCVQECFGFRNAEGGVGEGFLERCERCESGDDNQTHTNGLTLRDPSFSTL